MNVIGCNIPDVLILEPKVFEDERGFFFESHNERAFAERAGVNARFVQDNQLHSFNGVVRGLHYQVQQPQGKLVRVTAGEVFDVAVDIRRSSPTFGKWVANALSAANRRMLWIPPGFAHGFMVVSPHADVLYKVTEFWAPQHERCILWNDSDLNIAWPLKGKVILSQKDEAGVPFRRAEVFP